MHTKHFQIGLVILISISNAHSRGSPWDWQISRRYPAGKTTEAVNSTTKDSRLPVESSNITVSIGETAVLPCKTRNLEENTASWIKGKDTSVLSVGLHKFSSDKRISIASGGRNSKEESFWILQIQNVTSRDEGWYECQVNTEPKISSKSYLTVTNPRDLGLQEDAPQLPQVIPQIQEFFPRIGQENPTPPKISLNSPDHQVKLVDQNLILECHIKGNFKLFWSFNGQKIRDYRLLKIITTENRNVASLHFSRLQKADEGVYLCKSNDQRIEPRQVNLEILTTKDSRSDKPIALPQLEVPATDFQSRVDALEQRLNHLEHKVHQLLSRQTSSSVRNVALPWTPMVWIFMIMSRIN